MTMFKTPTTSPWTCRAGNGIYESAVQQGDLKVHIWEPSAYPLHLKQWDLRIPRGETSIGDPTWRWASGQCRTEEKTERPGREAGGEGGGFDYGVCSVWANNFKMNSKRGMSLCPCISLHFQPSDARVNVRVVRSVPSNSKGSRKKGA